MPFDIPANPHVVYVDKGWSGYGDWLGTGNTASHLRQYRSFNDAREFAQGLGLKGQSEWRKFCKGEMPDKGLLPFDIPSSPSNVYASHGWSGYGDWLGTGNISNRQKDFLPFSKAWAFVRSLNLESQSEWWKYSRGNHPEKGQLPSGIPKSPNTTYADEGWNGFGDWLGTGNIAPQLRQYRSFQAARKFVQALRLKCVMDWRAFCKGGMPHLGKLPADIPASPDKTYANKGWSGYEDWLGTDRTRVSKFPKRKSIKPTKSK